MAGMQIGGGNFGGNFGIGAQGGLGGLDALGQGQGGIQDAMKLLKQLAEALGLDPQSGGKCQGKQAPQGAQGAQGAGGQESGESDPLELLKKLRELAQQNPQALMAALQQMPGLASALSGAMMGSGGGASGAGMTAAA